MLEIHYESATGNLVAWHGSRFGVHKPRPGIKVTLLDQEVPDKPLEAWKYNEGSGELEQRQDYTPKPTLQNKWDQALTQSDKLSVIAEAVGLEA